MKIFNKFFRKNKNKDKKTDIKRIQSTINMDSNKLITNVSCNAVDIEATKAKQKEFMLETIIKEALKELKEKDEKIDTLEKNIDVLITTNEKVKEICKKVNSKYAKEILKELGE